MKVYVGDSFETANHTLSQSDLTFNFSGCAMPCMYDICEDLGYDKRVYKFGIPLTVTFNANGSSFFISVAIQVGKKSKCIGCC